MCKCRGSAMGERVECVYCQAEANVQRKKCRPDRRNLPQHTSCSEQPLLSLSHQQCLSRIFMWKFVPDVQAQTHFLYTAVRALTTDNLTALPGLEETLYFPSNLLDPLYHFHNLGFGTSMMFAVALLPL